MIPFNSQHEPIHKDVNQGLKGARELAWDGAGVGSESCPALKCFFPTPCCSPYVSSLHTHTTGWIPRVSPDQGFRGRGLGSDPMDQLCDPGGRGSP